MSPGPDESRAHASGRFTETYDSDVLHDALLALLRDADVEFRHVRHAPTRTSEESAAARGEPLAIGGKTLLLKVDDRFALFVLSAARRMVSSLARKAAGARRSRFATKAELLELTGLVPGTLPPFGEPLLPFPLRADRSVMAQDRIAFNAASPTESIVMATADWVRIARPTLCEYTRM